MLVDRLVAAAEYVPTKFCVVLKRLLPQFYTDTSCNYSVYSIDDNSS
jgi:hypothetical protein